MSVGWANGLLWRRGAEAWAPGNEPNPPRDIESAAPDPSDSGTCVFALARPANVGAPTLRGTGTATAASLTLVITLTTAIGVGERAFAAGGGRGATADLVSVADARGNTWALDKTVDDATGNNAVGIASAPVTTGLQVGDAVTMTFAAGPPGPSLQGAVFAASGIAGSGALDKSATNVGTWDASSHWTGGSSGTLSQADELVIGVVLGSLYGSASTPDAGYTTLAYVASSGAASGDRPLSVVYGVVGATTAVNPGATISVPAFGGYGALTVTYKAALVVPGETIVDAGTCTFRLGRDYSNEVMADRPDTYFLMDDAVLSTTLADATGNGHTATLNSALPAQQPSLVRSDLNGKAIRLNYNVSPFRADTSYTVSQEPLTIEFWINPTTLSSWGGGAAWNVPVSNGVTGGWVVKYISATGVWRLTKPGVGDFTFTAVAVAGKTQHVVFVMQTDHSVDLYIDGVFQQNVTGGAIGATTDPLRIGSSGPSNPDLLDAVLDHIAIYRSALSAARIASHFESATPSLAGAEVISDAGTCTLSLTPTSAGESGALGQGYLGQGYLGGGYALPSYGAETIADAGTATVGASQAASETISDAATNPAVFSFTASESLSGGSLSDAGTATLSITPTAVEQIVDATSASIVLAPTGVETFSDAGTNTVVVAPSATESIVEAATQIVVVAPSATERPSDAGSVSLTLSETASETVSDAGSQIVVVLPTSGSNPSDAGTCAFSVTSTSAETVSDAASTALVLAPSYEFVWPDSGTCTFVVLPSAAEQVQDSSTVIFVLTEADSERESDQGTVPIALIPSGGEALVEARWDFFAIGRGDLFMPDDLVYPDDVAGPDYVHGFEAILDAGSSTVVVAPSAAEVISEGGTTFVTITPVAPGVEQGNASFALVTTALETIVEGASMSLALVPSGGVALVDSGADYLAIARGDLFGPDSLVYPDDLAGPDYVHGFEAITDVGAATIVVPPSAAEVVSEGGGALVVITPVQQGIEQGNASVVVTSTALETIIEAGTATLGIAPSAAEQIQQASTVTLALVQTETDALVDAATCVVVVAQLSAATIQDAGTATLAFPETAVSSEQDAGTATLALVASASEAVTDSGTAVILLTQTAFETTIFADSGTCTISMTPSATERVSEAATVSFVLAPIGGETIIQAGSLTITLSQAEDGSPSESGVAIMTLLATTTVAQPLEAGTCTFNADGVGAETLVDVPVTVTFVVTPTYFGGAPGAAGNQTITLSQTAVETIVGDPSVGTCVLVIDPSHTWTVGFDPYTPTPLQGGDSAERRRQRVAALRAKANASTNPEHRDRKLARR